MRTLRVLLVDDHDGFINLYEQMLPDHSGGSLVSLASGVDAVTRALTGRNASAAPGETSAWMQEINFYADKDKTDSYGFRSEGFGLAALGQRKADRRRAISGNIGGAAASARGLMDCQHTKALHAACRRPAEGLFHIAADAVEIGIIRR